jgi:hypothetical protein
MYRPRPDGIFPRMSWIARLLLWVVALLAIFSMIGCTGSGSQAEPGHAHQSDNVKLELRPEHNSEVTGTASFEDITDGVVVKLELRGLPKPNTLYLAHIHPGTCAEGEEEKEAHEHGEEIEYPLSQAKSNSEGHGSSTTTLGKTSVDKLFLGEPKHLNVHEADSGNPPILTCADLKRAG